MRRFRGSLLAAWLFASALGCHGDSPSDNPQVALAEPTNADLLKQAEAALDAYDEGRAIEIADRVLAKEPDNPAFLVIRGSAYDTFNRLTEALADYDRALKADPENARALRCRSSILYGAYDRFEEALADLRRSLKIEPRSASGHALLAEQLANRDADANSKEIEAELDKALRLDPKCMAIKEAQFVYLLFRNDIDKARAVAAEAEALPHRPGVEKFTEGLLAIVEKDSGKARRAFVWLTENAPPHLRNLGHQGLIFYHKNFTNDRRAEIAECDRTMKIRPNATLLLARAEIHFAEKSYSLAVADINEYLKFNPRGSKRAYWIRADSLAQSGRQLEALEDFERTYKLDPNDTNVRREGAQAKGLLLHTQDAIADRDECVRLKPESAETRRLRAVTLTEFGRYGAALKDLDEASKLRPEGPHVDAYIAADRAACLMAENRMEEAIAAARAAVRLHPDWPGFRYLLAFVLYRSGQTEKAMDSLDDFLRMKPGEVQAMIARAACLAKLGKSSEAVVEVARIRLVTGPVFPELGLRDVGHAEGLELSRDACLHHELIDQMARRSPENLLLHLRRARVMMVNGADDEAVAECDRVLARDPKCWLALSLRANARCESAPALAIADCERGASMNPSHHGFPLARGIAHRKLGNLNLAIRDFDEAIRLRPCIGRLYTLRAETWRALGEPVKAAADASIADNLGSVPFIDPRDAELWQNLVNASKDEAMTHVERILSLNLSGRHAEVVRIWSEFLAGGFPVDNPLRTAVADSLFQSGKPTAAIALLDEAVRADPKDADALAVRGFQHYLLQHHRKALADLSESLRLMPDSGITLLRRSFVHNALGQFEPAIEDGVAWTSKNPNDTPTNLGSGYRTVGLSRLQRGDSKAALADFRQAVAIEPNNAFNHFSVAFAHYRCGEFAEAIKELDRTALLHAFGNDKEALAARGACLMKLGRTKEAAEQFAKAKAAKGGVDRPLADFEAALQRNPNNMLALAYRARMLLANGETERAVADCTRALEIDPECVIALAVRAEALAERDPDRAIADCTRGAQLSPTYFAFPMHRGIARFRKGNFVESLADLDEAIRQRPWIGKLYRLRAKTLEALHEDVRASADLARAAELGELAFVCPDDFELVLSRISVALAGGAELPPPLEVPADLATIAPPPPSSGAAPGPLPQSLKTTPISLTDGWTAPKINANKAPSASQFIAPTSATAADADRTTAPPPPLVVPIPTKVPPTELPLPPGAKLLPPVPVDPTRLPPPLIVPTSGETPALPLPKR